jgi:hypothetical protein
MQGVKSGLDFPGDLAASFSERVGVERGDDKGDVWPCNSPWGDGGCTNNVVNLFAVLSFLEF